jgi:hypothetical protein
MITFADVGNAGSSLDNHASAFMSEQVWKKFVFALSSIDFSELGAADTCTMNLNQHLAAYQLGNSDFVHDQRRS